MYKVHCLNNISQKGLALLSSDYELTDDVSEADVILVRSANMHEMEFSDNLKAVARAGAGVNNIPLDALAERGIPVFNTPGANANAVKELVLCALLLAARDVVGGAAWCRHNADDENIAKSAEKAKKQFAGTEIMGKTLGVIGLGAIGCLVIPAAEALGMKTVGYDPFLDAERAAAISPNLRFTDDLLDLCASCDYITIHVPATPKTKGMIGADEIAAMKEGAAFLNFSRDTLVDNDAMRAGLTSGKVRRYVTDFATPEVMTMEGAQRLRKTVRKWPCAKSWITWKRARRSTASTSFTHQRPVKTSRCQCRAQRPSSHLTLPACVACAFAGCSWKAGICWVRFFWDLSFTLRPLGGLHGETDAVLPVQRR